MKTLQLLLMLGLVAVLFTGKVFMFNRIEFQLNVSMSVSRKISVRYSKCKNLQKNQGHKQF